MPSINGSDNPGPGELPTFQADTQQVTRVREFPGIAGDEGAKVFGDLSRQLGAWEDRTAEDAGVRAGKVAGLDANYRPDGDESLYGMARRNAANATYGNMVETQARSALGDAYETYNALPPAQQNPQALAAKFQSIQDDFHQNHVFPEVQGAFDNSFSRLSDAYTRAAQGEADKRTQDQAKASFLTNQNSARDTAMKLASLPATSDADIAGAVAQHNAAIDNAVGQGIYTASQAVEMKSGFQNDVAAQYALTKFDATPDALKPQFAANFRTKFLGNATESEQQLATRIQMTAPSLTNEQCVELARKVGGIGEGVTGWRKGLSATEAQLPVGTPVATFLNRDGSPSNLYDGGQGVGLPGNNTTHAGIVAGYTPEGDLKLWEQYGGSGGPHIAVYKAGDTRGGEKDANNYFSISGADGRPLGLNNPLNRSAVPTPSSAGLDFATASRVTSQMDGAIRGINSQAEHAQKLAISDIGDDLKQTEAGFPVTDAEWAAKRLQYAASPDPIVADAFRTADSVRNLYAGFRGQTVEQVEAQAAALRGALSNGATPDQVRLVQAADKYAKGLRDDLNRDPLTRSAADGVIPAVAPLDFSSPQGLATSLRARVAAADQTRQHYGLGNSPLLTGDDKEALKQIAATGGEPMVQAATAAVRAMGPRAGEFLAQVGGDAPSFAQMGRVAVGGGDPGVMRDAAWAISQDHQHNGKVERPAPELLSQTASTAFGSAFRAVPDLAEGAKTLASSALAAQVAREGYDPKSLPGALVEQTLQKAAGATYVGSQQYGGVTNHGIGWSSEKVLAPGSLKAGQFDAALKTVTDADLRALPAPPAAPDGSVMTADQLRGLHFTSLGPGVYALSKGDPTSDDPQWVTVNGGQRGARSRFLLDLNAMEPQLRQRIPGAYR